MARCAGTALVLLADQGAYLSNPATVAANICNHRLAGKTGSGAFGKADGHLSADDNPREICEIAGVTDGGEPSERVMREIGSVITARAMSLASIAWARRCSKTPAGKRPVYRRNLNP